MSSLQDTYLNYFCFFFVKKFVKTKIPNTYQDANLHLVVSFLSVLIKYLQVFYQPSDDSDSVNTWNCYYADWFHVKNVGYGILHRYLQSTWYVVWCKKIGLALGNYLIPWFHFRSRNQINNDLSGWHERYNFESDCIYMLRSMHAFWLQMRMIVSFSALKSGHSWLLSTHDDERKTLY